MTATDKVIRHIFPSTHCPCCGKEFVIHKQGIYKLTIHGRIQEFCSYSCYRKIQSLQESKKLDEIDNIFSNSKNVVANRNQEE